MLPVKPGNQRTNARHFSSSEKAQSSSTMPGGPEVSLRRSPLVTVTRDRPEVSSDIPIEPLSELQQTEWPFVSAIFQSRPPRGEMRWIVPFGPGSRINAMYL